MRALQKWCCLVVALPLLVAKPMFAQSGCSTPPCGSTSGAVPNLPSRQPVPNVTDLDAGASIHDIQENQLRLRNAERQKEIVADTQKLVALANELKADVDKSNKDILSIDVIKKADEIEKLARQVRDKMKGS